MPSITAPSFIVSHPARALYFERAKVKVLITRKFKQRLSEISEVDVKKEGFETLEEFQACWTRIHGNWKPDIIVTVYEFKLARPEREPLEFSCARNIYKTGLLIRRQVCLHG